MDHLQRETRREYAARINRVIDFVQHNLDGDLRLERLAEVAGFSPWHFHRVFRAMTGETLAVYVQRIRLQCAASRLINSPRDKISQVAYACGFSSPSNFARSFKGYYGMSAGAYRELYDRKIGAVYRKYQLDPDNLGQEPDNEREDRPAPSSDNGHVVDDETAPRHPSERSPAMEFEVKDFPKRTVAYVRVYNGYDSKYIGPAFQKITTWAAARNLLGPGCEVIGISLDDPDVTPAEKCRYDACVTVPEGTRGDGEIGVYEIPAGKYAVGRLEGTYDRISEQLGAAWTSLFKDWFPSSGYKPGSSPCMEIYRETEEQMERGIFVCDLCEPVEPL